MSRMIYLPLIVVGIILSMIDALTASAAEAAMPPSATGWDGRDLCVLSDFNLPGIDDWTFEGAGGTSNPEAGGNGGGYVSVGDNLGPHSYGFAPPGFNGTNVSEGDILVADRGYSGADEIWAFSPDTAEGELRVMPDPGSVDIFVLASALSGECFVDSVR